MTIREAAAQFGTKVMKASSGDNITTLVDRIYKSRDDLYFMILQTLNNRLDWDMVEADASILYIPKLYCTEIYEITS